MVFGLQAAFFQIWRGYLKRNITIDYLRGGVTLLVVLHHSALAYTFFSHYDPVHYLRSTAPIVDNVRWMALDLIVDFNEKFFMPLMFLISGLFVPSSLERKGSGRFLMDRAKRLGIPFIFSAIILSPLAYYPSWLLSETARQGKFLTDFLKNNNWTPGPAWFIWLLLAFSSVIAIANRMAPSLTKRLSLSISSTWQLLGISLAVSLLTSIPLSLFFSTDHWTRLWGPFVFQTWKLLLYFAWFMLGFAFGSANLELSLSKKNLRYWHLWLALGIILYVVQLGLRPENFGNIPQWTIKIIQAIAYSLCCTFISLAAIGFAHSFFRTAWPLADSFAANAYGVYIFHYVFVIWIQFFLLAKPLPAAIKFLLTLFIALILSWLLTAILRKTVAGKIL